MTDRAAMPDPPPPRGDARRSAAHRWGASRWDASRWWPLAAVVALAAVVLGVDYLRILAICDGQLIYGLDDTYIHMALARTLAQDGTWGIRPGEFIGLSSSILWPLLLAAVDLVVGVREGTPLVINLVLALVILVRADALAAARSELSPPWRAVILAALFLCTPMPSMVFDGMEHLLQILITIELLHRAGRLLAGGAVNGQAVSGRAAAASRRADLLWLVALAALGTSVRYEALFQVAAVAALAAAQRRPLAAAALSAAGLAPVLIYGAVLSAHGWPFLPTGLVLKTVMLEPTAFEAARRLFNEFAGKVPAAMPLALALGYTLGRFAFVRRGDGGTGPRTDADLWAGLVFALSALGHLALAHLGNLFRYEAYLYAGAVFVLAVPLAKLTATTWDRLRQGPALVSRVAATVIAVGVIGFPVVQRSLASVLAVPLAASDIYHQQVQMARFLDTYYPGEVVAINDIGAIAYYTDLHIVDTWGLATREVADLKHTEHFPCESLVPVLRDAGAEIALVYKPWIGTRVPRSWTLVGQWRVEEKIVLGWHEVSFYATEPGAEERLLDAFVEFRETLPDAVTAETAEELR